MKNNTPRKPHVVLLPFPAQGHLNPMFQLAKLLHSRGFFITYVNTEFNHNRFVRSKGPDWAEGFSDFQFTAMADGLPHSDRDATQNPVELCDSIRKNCMPIFRDLIAKLVSDVDLPSLSCIIADGVMSIAIEAGAEFGIPVAKLWTASACGFMGYLQYVELINRGTVPFKDEDFAKNGLLETEVDWIPGMSNMRLKDMPSFIRTTDINDIMLNYLKDETQNCLKASAIICNTFYDLEHRVLNAMAPFCPPIYTIGPLTLLSQNAFNSDLNSFNSSLWKEDRTCMEWLDKQRENSVVYVNYGCVTVISDDHLNEFAWGLANSKHPFLWIIRPDIAMGQSAILPKAFYEETKDRALLTYWCPQEDVLNHPAVAVFLSHCGWNSTLESMSAGVPMLCWPFFAEQQTNCRYLCEEWEMGLEIDHEVNREDIEGHVRDVIEGEKGKKMKAKALEWKAKAKYTTGIGGSSYLDFDRFVKEVLIK